MVQNNKILTVSYGAFSCTLEGFDDSLDTMKAVAGYFRDLAAEDRHFGAEPLQADAEALTRIAGRGMSRSIGAQGSDGGVVDAAPSTGPRPAMNRTTASAPQSIADKLQRIRAVVSQSESLADNYCEDEPADIFISAAAEDISHALRHEDDVFYGAAEDAEDEELSRAPDRMDDDLQAAQEAGEIPADHASGVEMASPAFVDSAGLDWPDVSPTSFAFDTATVEYADAGTLLDVADPNPDVDGPLGEGMNDSRMPEADVNQADHAVDVESGALHETADADRPASPAFLETAVAEADEPSIPAGGSLSRDDEAASLREIVAHEADGEDRIDGDESSVVKDLESRDESSLYGPARPDVSQDTDITRLMASVEAQMDDAQTASSRETYGQMRAAVADADAVEDDLRQKGDATAYHDDLANAVRPRRPVAMGSSTRVPRPTRENRPPPLKLVAEQRVDLPHTRAAVGPVHPRRVALASTGDGIVDDSGRFAQFAEEVGANSLPELLEAAAAYLSFVEKHAQFSRPQLINTVRQLENRSFNREDGLHQFGELLREGKIAKTDGGCFTASEDIGFRPDKRAVG